MAQKHEEGSTGQLLNLCFWYFIFYILTGIFVKFFVPFKVSDMEWLVWSTLGSNVLCIGVVFALGWFKLKSSNLITWGGITFPKEYLYIIPSGICTAVVIPTTTLMYSLPITVMVAMVIMRGSIIVLSRLIDEIQIRLGILKKKVYWQENVGVVIAVLAVSAQLFLNKKVGMDFFTYGPAMVILSSYLVAYFIRIYIMNYYKNTRPKGAVYDTKGFFGVEQISSTITMITVSLLVFNFVNPVKVVTGALDWKDAGKQVNQTQTFMGEVVDIKKTDEGTFLTFSKEDSTALRVIIPKDLDKKFTVDTEKLFKGRIVSVTGSVNQVNNSPELLVQTKNDIKIQDFKQVRDFKKAFTDTHSNWPWQMIFGSFFGAVAFFSVFIFMFKGRTATFAGLVNRLTSLIAGTVSTLIVWFVASGTVPAITQWLSNVSGVEYSLLVEKVAKFPKAADWVTLVLIFVAVWFLGLAENRRVAELKKEKEL